MAAVFKRSAPAGIHWNDVESLLRACGADIEERAGSRVAIELNGVIAVFHRPHPRNDVDKGAIASVRRFLTEAGIKQEA